MISCSVKSLAPTVREGAGSAHAAARGSRHKAVAMRAERRRCDSRVMGFILRSVWVQGIDAARDEVVLGLADQEIEQHRDERGGQKGKEGGTEVGGVGMAPPSITGKSSSARPVKINSPNPPAPIRNANGAEPTQMARAVRMPPQMTNNPFRNYTRQNTSAGVIPMPRAASSRCGGTARRPT